jgi:hypothetical protein
MKEKAKKVIRKTIGTGIGILCDAALIYNFIHRKEPTDFGIYCQRYIVLFTIYSWIAFVCAVIVLVSFEIALRRDDYRKKNLESIKDSVERARPKFWKTLWLWFEHIPMTIFVGIFVGNYNLFTVWILLAIFQVALEKTAVKVDAKIKAGSPSFTEVMAELDKKSSMN